MQPLVTPQKVLTWFCVWFDNENKWKKAACVLFISILILINSTALVASVLYFLKCVVVDFESSLKSITQINNILRNSVHIAVTIKNYLSL